MRSKHLIALTLCAGAACNDALSPRSLPPSSPPPSVAANQYPDEADVAHLASRVDDLGLTVGAFIAGSVGTAHAVADFFANYANLEVQLTIVDNGREISTSSGTEQFEGFAPIPWTLSKTVERDVGTTCGRSVEAKGIASAQIRALGMGGKGLIVVSGYQTDKGARMDQPVCPKSPSGGPDPTQLCQLCVEWTWYYGDVPVEVEERCSGLFECPMS